MTGPLPLPPFHPWAEFERVWPRLYSQGDHVTIVGPTESGKTTLAIKLQRPRKFVVAVATKPKDSTMDGLVKSEGFTKITKWSDTMRPGRYVLWPDISTMDAEPQQRATIHRFLKSSYSEGSWTIFCDELLYLSDMLGLKRPLRLLWTQGRSIHLSMIGLTQRPALIPLEAYSQARHLFLFKTGDERDLVRLGSINGTSARLVANVVAELQPHEWLYVNTATGRMLRSLIPLEH